jgi:hypothetical protein
MRRLLLIIGTLLVAQATFAAVPLTMSYQGVLQDRGAPVPDDDYTMYFAIYTAEVGGALLWSESRSVGVEDGIFNVILGEATPLDLDFDTTYWLEISVEGEAPMTPRTELTPAPYAHRAIVAESLEGGVPADADWSMNGDIAYRTNDVGIGTATPQSKLTVSSDAWDDHLTISRLGNDSGHISLGANNMVLWTGSGSGLYVAGSGNIGVGVASPTSKLQVDGTVQITGLRMSTGAADGYVLTSDASGNGSWQPAQSGVGGSGTADYVPKFTGATTLGNSSIRLSGTMVGINTLPAATLHVNGTMDVEDETYFHSDVFSTNLQSDAGLTLASGSVNRMHLDSVGNVGIGTMSPGAMLDVAGTVEVQDLTVTGSSQTPSLSVTGTPDTYDLVVTGEAQTDGLDVNGLAEADGLVVTGTAQVNGLRIPANAGFGKILTSDSDGDARWQDPEEIPSVLTATDNAVGGSTVIGSTVTHFPDTDVAVTVPGPGLVVVTASVTVYIEHTQGTADNCHLWVSESPTASGNYATYISVPSTAPDWYPGTVVTKTVIERYPVTTSGTYHYYVTAMMADGASSYDQFGLASMHAVYYPTSAREAQRMLDESETVELQMPNR